MAILRRLADTRARLEIALVASATSMAELVRLQDIADSGQELCMLSVAENNVVANNTYLRAVVDDLISAMVTVKTLEERQVRP